MAHKAMGLLTPCINLNNDFITLHISPHAKSTFINFNSLRVPWSVFLTSHRIDMLSIEYTHKRSKIFRIELSLVVYLYLVGIIIASQIQSMIKILK